MKYKVEKAVRESEEVENELKRCKELLEKYKKLIRETELSPDLINKKYNVTQKAIISEEDNSEGKAESK